VIDAGQPIAKIFRDLQRRISRLQLKRVRTARTKR
jgi:hypothetical protein